MLSPSDASATKYNWAEPTLGGKTFFPRVERALTVKAGDMRDLGRLSARYDDHDLLHAIGENAALKYNTVPEVLLLDTKDKDFWYIDWHLAHELPSSTWWEVDFFVRQCTSPYAKRIGYTMVLESLASHGKSVVMDLVSPIPKKRKRDLFGAEDDKGEGSSKDRGEAENDRGDN
ncbi:hypothetical protein CF327_g7203 [Tilletia walkeri]|nr:hypothetical protein CF327_g7203 [Tilletia walkeri]